MGQRPSVESPTQSPVIVDVHPKLQRALEHIDVRLEEELTRYRRQKAGLAVAPTGATGWQRKSTPKPVALPLDRPPLPQLTSGKQPALTAPGLMGHQPAVPDAIADQATFGLPLESPAAGFAAPNDADLFTQLTAPAAHPEPIGHSLQTTFDDDDDRFSLADNAAQLDDYLESSEALLRSLATQKAQVQVEKSFLEYLVTPLGIGSMLMLLLSSAMLGYVIMNPSSLMAVGRLLPTAAPAPSPSPVAASPESAGPIANSPPLDSQEFVDLGLENLTALGTRPKSTLSATPTLPNLKGKKSPIAAKLGGGKPGTPNLVGLTGPIVPSPLRIPAGPPIPTRPMPAASTYSAPTPNYHAPAASPAARNYNPSPARPRSQSPLPAVTYTPQPPAALPSIKVTPAESYQEPSPQAPPSSPTYSNSTPADVGVRFESDQQLEQVQKIAPGAGGLRNTDNGAYIPVPLDKVQELQNQGISVEPIPHQ